VKRIDDQLRQIEHRLTRLEVLLAVLVGLGMVEPARALLSILR
jgi:hypothetical protein